MRRFLPAIVLLLATTATWFSASAAPAAAGAPSEYPSAEQCAPDQCGDQCTCGEAGACSESPCNPCQCGPRWTFAAEGIAFQRTSPRRQPLFETITTQPVFVPLDGTGSHLVDPITAGDLNFPVGYGYKLSAIRHNDCGLDLEVGYFQIDGFDARASAPGLSLLVTDVNGTGFVVYDGEARYTSAIYSGEVNVRKECCDCITFLAGFRMLQLNEHYRGAGETLVDNQLEWSTASVATNTFNHLYGFQLGAEGPLYDMGGSLVVNAFCKAGIYDDVAHQDYRRMITESGGTIFVDQSFQGGRDQAAFVGEAGLVLTYAVTKHLAFRGSAEAMWLTDVALAPDQISSVNLRTGHAGIDTAGTVFYYGGGVGMECRF